MEWIESEPDGHEIGPDEVHLWRFPLGSPAASQAALRTLLSAYTGTQAAEIELTRGAHGKPMLAVPESGIDFNTSHSGAWVVIAIARVPVGVDVEQVRPGRHSPALEKRFLTEGERALLRQRAGSDGETAFFFVWCRKEAYLKATGLGLAGPFSRIDSSAARLPELDQNGAQLAGATPWTVAEFFVDEKHTGAVVARADRLSVRLFTLRRQPG